MTIVGIIFVLALSTVLLYWYWIETTAQPRRK